MIVSMVDHFFNSRSPYGERHAFIFLDSCFPIFNSRSPYGERHQVYSFLHSCSDVFNSRSPYGERHDAFDPERDLAPFSIHAPRMGSDKGGKGNMIKLTFFQFTLPVWGATISFIFLAISFAFSIHAPRMGSDVYSFRRFAQYCIFNSRSPYGERR